MTDLETAINSYLISNPDTSIKDFLNEVKSICKDFKTKDKKIKKDSSSVSTPKTLGPYQLFVKDKTKQFKDETKNASDGDHIDTCLGRVSFSLEGEKLKCYKGDGTLFSGKEVMKEIALRWKSKDKETIVEVVPPPVVETPQKSVGGFRGKSAKGDGSSAKK